MLSLVVFLSFILRTIMADIMYIDAKRHIQSEINTKHTEDESAPLSLSSFFAQSDTYKCLVESNGDKNCVRNKNPNTYEKEKKKYFGPKFQPIHLALPVREQHEVGFKETLMVNNREMTITTLSKSPQVYEITNFMSSNETELVLDLAKFKRLKSANLPKSQLYMPEEISERIFDQWDEDFNGHLSLNEVYNIRELNPLLLSKADLVEIINESKIDKDANDYISYGEFSNNNGYEKFMEALKDYDSNRRQFLVKGLKESWLWHDDDELLAYEDLLEDYHQRLEMITNIPEEVIEQSEPLQVTKHEKDSSTHCQQDSMTVGERPCCVYGATNCRMCRFATIMVFLNDVENGGELIFPLADNATFLWENLKTDMLNKCEKTPNPETSNLVIKPTRGKAILWYNHVVSPNTGWLDQHDPQSLAGISPIKDNELWSAKIRININGDGVNELRGWKMGMNWLKGSNKNENIIEKMRNDYFIEGEPYVHQYRKSYKYVYNTSEDQKSHALESHTVKEDGNTKIQTDQTPKLQKIESTSQVLSDTIPAETQLRQNTGNENTSGAEGSRVEIKTDKVVASNDYDTDTTIEIIDTAVDNEAVVKSNTEEHNKESEGSKREFLKHYVPLGPPKRPVDPLNPYAGKIIENRLVRASLLLLEELERDELEIIARSLHDKLQLACIPLIVNPISL